MTTFAAPTGPPPLLGEVQQLIQRAANGAPRSRQRAIGPSELGTPCRRRLSLKLLGAEDRNPGSDRWPSVVGTAVHAWMADMLADDNAAREAAGQPKRWLIEERVTIRQGLSGSCDAYDLLTDTIIDWKAVGASTLKKYRAGPGQQYRTQAHLYGLGWLNRGLTPKHVAVVFLPRAGWLSDAHMWSEPFDPQVAHDALQTVDELVIGMNVAEQFDALDDFLRLLPRDTDGCRFCPYYTTDRSVAAADGCAGVMEGKQ